MMSLRTWKNRLNNQIPSELGRDIDIFETQMELRQQDKLDEKLFAEIRLRRGAYGQRYDNGQRHDGLKTTPLAFPSNKLSKGPSTLWDAPGMMRIKIPMGVMSNKQLEVLAELAEEYSDGILHVTTRQDIQLHFVHIEDTPDLMRRLAVCGITTQEACGNSVRNVTACPLAGVCHDEPFDVTPYADAFTYYFLGHRDVQDFGRKFKVAFSGCAQHACGLANFHCIGAVARTRQVNGKEERGFELFVGGGLGAVPRQAQVLEEFVSEDEMLPVSQAICRVFARLGEKENRARARLKFLVKKVGIEEFTRLVREERASIPDDEKWLTFLGDLHKNKEKTLKPDSTLSLENLSAEFLAWHKSNVHLQRQEGYAVATIRLPLGDLTSTQSRGLAIVAGRFTGDTIRTTVEQNLVLRWVSVGDLPELYEALNEIGLADPGAGTISDITACPGTDTCKLGISASRGLAAVLEERLAKQTDSMHPDVSSLRVKTSGCFNSCGQHHVADIGFLGVSRNVGGRRVAHFQLVLGGEWANNGGSYGLAIGAFPSKRIPEVVDCVTQHWIAERETSERIQDYVKRVGRAHIKGLLEHLREVPDYDQDKSFYTDWGDAREYTIGDIGVGECAGEVVSLADFGLAASEREAFEAQLYLDTKDAHKAADLAYRAMLSAAKALIRVQYIDVSDDADEIVSEFKTRFFDTRIFHDPFAGAKFANYLFKRHEEELLPEISLEDAHQQIEETLLFIEAAYGCHDRMQEQAS
ncbi:MAG TPA: nitrite/sulfite reductase [Myxococcales bacterium]|nr:nitrite/sulfite reductase [Myxococcales bacterium]